MVSAHESWCCSGHVKSHFKLESQERWRKFCKRKPSLRHEPALLIWTKVLQGRAEETPHEHRMFSGTSLSKPGRLQSSNITLSHFTDLSEGEHGHNWKSLSATWLIKSNWTIYLIKNRDFIIPNTCDQMWTNPNRAEMVKNLSAMWETRVWSLGQEDTLQEELATHSSILVWRIPWTEEPGGLQSMGSQRVGHDWATPTHTVWVPD